MSFCVWEAALYSKKIFRPALLGGQTDRLDDINAIQRQATTLRNARAFVYARCPEDDCTDSLREVPL